jgi:hypothetical protein
MRRTAMTRSKRTNDLNETEQEAILRNLKRLCIEIENEIQEQPHPPSFLYEGPLPPSFLFLGDQF